MNRYILKTKTVVLVFAATALLLTFSTVASADWWSFRGENGSNIAEKVVVPVEISAEKNVAWKIELPGRGPSGPIVVGDRVFATCSGGDKEDQLYVVCCDAKSGEKIWQRRFWATGRCFCHPLSANAAPTPCTDGQFIYAFYSSNDLICLDLEGNLQWCRGLAVDHPKAGHDTGMSSSPVVHGNVVVCQVENQGDSFAVGIDKTNGKTLWEIPREKDASWSSPLIFNTGENQKPLCVLNSGTRATVVDLVTGKTVYEKVGSGNPVPSSTVVDDQLFLPIDGLTVVKFSAAGDTFQETMNSTRLAAGAQSNIVHGEKIYTFGRGGVMTCSALEGGESLWKARIGGQHWTTPLLVNGHMYFFDQAGMVSVVNVEGQFADAADRIVHTTEFKDEVFLCSPAACDNAIFMRSDKFLYKFAQDPS